MSYFVVLACGAGLGAGLTARWISTAVSKWFATEEFWRRLIHVGRSMLSSPDEGQVFHEYLQLWPLLLRFLSRQVVVTTLAVAPVVVAFLALNSLAPPRDDHNYLGQYLSSWESDFFVSVGLAMVVGMLVLKFKA